MDNEEKPQEKTEETASEDLPEEHKENEPENLNTLILDLKKQYEEKIESITKSKNDEIKARDDIIKQLFNNDNKKSTTTTIADRINEKRNFKKW